VRILILGLNYHPEEIGIGPYTAGLAEALALLGHQTEVVAGKPYYPEWRRRPGPRGILKAVERGVTVWRCPHYVPGRPTAMRRILHYLSFAVRALPVMWARAGAMQPDAVIAIAPALMAAPVALLAARRTGAVAWLHIQDFEVEAALATGLLARGPLAALARGFERAVLRRFDRVSTISHSMAVKAIEKKVAPEHVIEIRNWAECEAVNPSIDGRAMRRELQLPDGHIALYSGNLAMKQGIGLIAEAAELLRHRSDIQFVICGDGSGRAAFAGLTEAQANIHLRPLQPRSRLGELLALADVHLLPQIAGTAELVLPSKLTNMLASGRPVIATADAGTDLFREIAGCGVATPPGDAPAFAAAIARLIDDPREAAQLGAAARHRALQNWSRETILQQFVAAIEAAVVAHY
jgi:colanic acid biosynthesis glycosyl transferase WcaI